MSSPRERNDERPAQELRPRRSPAGLEDEPTAQVRPKVGPPVEEDLSLDPDDLGTWALEELTQDQLGESEPPRALDEETPSFEEGERQMMEAIASAVAEAEAEAEAELTGSPPNAEQRNVEQRDARATERAREARER